jgi:two-component system sensor histidine kinase MtrB
MLSQQSKRLFELVENLLDLSRLEADSLRISPIEIEVRERLVEIIDAVFDGSGEVEIEAPVELRAVVDPQVFDRVLSNLLTNAVRHGAPPFFVSAARTTDELSVRIEDRGSGIAEEFVGSLFERFTRGATPSSEGAGLGLSIAQSYARAHGGTLTYEPAKPHGASFRVILPVAAVAGPRGRLERRRSNAGSS